MWIESKYRKGVVDEVMFPFLDCCVSTKNKELVIQLNDQKSLFSTVKLQNTSYDDSRVGDV